LAPLFAFGFGLSYTQFDYSNLKITPITTEGEFSLSFEVKNTGNVEGREISQVYISDLQSSLPRAGKELKGFAKTYLKPGESKTIEVSLDREALGFYDDRSMHWIAEEGIFDVQIGASSEDIKLAGKVELENTFTWTGL